MVARIVIYRSSMRRSEAVCGAMHKGLKALGINARLKHERGYREPEGDVAIFYGLAGNLKRVFRDYRRGHRKAVYIDLGYWGRREGGRFHGYHKVAVNGRHPTAYFQQRKHGPSRFEHFGLKVRDWRERGKHILVAGMSVKAAEVENLAFEQWERDAIRRLREVTDRPIIYRPKPGRSHLSKPIRGVGFSGRNEPIEKALQDAHAVVTHHSNVSVDGLINGIPAFCVEGVAAPMACEDIGKIETPLYPEAREQWLADVAWCQWSIREMAAGEPWRHLKEEGIVP